MCATAPRRGPLPKLLWADLYVNSSKSCCNIQEFTSLHYT